MWRWVALLCLTAISAQADSNDLSGGVFIQHRPPLLDWSCIDQYGVCPAYDVCEIGIQRCEDQLPRMDESMQAVLWYVIAAWTETKIWGGVEFGLGPYPSDWFYIMEHGPCFQGTGLELPTADFPAPNSGTSLAAIDTPWEGNFRPVCWFVGYAYYADPGQFPLTVHPISGFGGFANNESPPVMFSAVCFGSLGIFEDGVSCCPAPATPAVCCLGEVCVLLETEFECASLSGVWHPEWDRCSPNPCAPPPLVVCCVGYMCYYVTEEECDAMGGVVQPEYDSCDEQPGPCHYEPPEPDVCCLGSSCTITTLEMCYEMQGEWHPEYDDCELNPCLVRVCCRGESCLMASEEECALLGGVFHPEWETCGPPNPCLTTPVPARTWGSIKSLYR